MSNLSGRIKQEIKELIPVTVFFFVAFQLLAMTQTLMLKRYGIRVETFAAAAFGALVVAKVVLITDHFPFVNRFPTRPLIYNILWKTAIYFVASVVVRYVEHLIHFWRRSDSFAEANQRIADQIIWPHVLCVQLWLLVLLLVYCALRELVRAIGRERVMAVLFTDPNAGRAQQAPPSVS